MTTLAMTVPAGASSQSPRWFGLYLVFVAILAGPIVGIGGTLLVFGPKLTEIFVRFHTTLPATTEFLLTASVYAQSRWTMLLGLVFLLSAPYGLTMWTLHRSKKSRGQGAPIVGATAVICLLFTLLAMLSLLAPLVQLTHSMLPGSFGMGR